MKRNLTDRLLRSLARTTAPFEVWDQSLRSFVCRRAEAGGVISFSAVRRIRRSGKVAPVRITVGQYPLWSLGEARERARHILRDLYDGIDPRERERGRLAAEAAKRGNAFSAVAEDFIRLHVVHARTARDIELRIRRELISRWADRPINEITSGDVIAMVAAIVDRGHPEAARSALTYAKRLFSWAVGRGVLTHSPAESVRTDDLIRAKQRRQRALSDSELALVWPGAGGFTEGVLVQLLFLLGQRLRETMHATWSEIDLDRAVWLIGPERMKAGEGHAVPLPAAAVALLRTLPRFPGSDFVFTFSGARPLTDPSGMKQRLDERVAALNGGAPLEHWTFHDARRTFRTGLSTLGIRPDIAELCIAHAQPGLAKTYDLHRFEVEKRHAFNSWAAHVAGILNPAPDKVVRLPKGRRR